MPARQSGFSIIELLIASSIALIVISAVYIVSFGNQSTVLSSETNSEAVIKTQQLLESQQAAGRQDFNLVNSTSSTDGVYKKGVDVQLLPDLLTKQVTASTTWKGDHGQILSVKITTLITSLDSVTSPNTCNSSLTNPNGWKTPVHYDFQTTSMLPPPSSNGISISDIDILNKRMYIVSDSPPVPNPETFFVFDLSSNPSVTPTFRGRIDNNVSSTEGLSGLSVASTTSKIYAYASSLRGSNFSNCVPGTNCAQLQVFDVTSPSAPTIVANYLVPTSTAPFVLGNGGTAVGKTVVYKDGYIYLGLKKTTSGPEFIIIDVGGGGLGTPTSPKYVGSFPIGFTVNAIQVEGDYAYVATTDTAAGNKRLLILNISNKTTPKLSIAPVGGFFTAGGIGVGNTVSVVGTKVYFGTAFSGAAIPNFYILNGSNPASYPSALPQYGVGTVAGTNDSVNAISVRDYLVFLLTNNQFQVWNISNPSAPTPWSTSGTQSTFLNLSLLGANGGTSSDCEGNVFYLALKSAQGNTKDIVSAVLQGP